MSPNAQRFRVRRAEEGQQFAVMGAAMTYKATAEDTGGAYSLAIETTPPHGGLPLHVHGREDEAMYILDGEYEIQCGEHVVRATPGTFVFLPRGTPNRYQNCGATTGRFIHITSPGGFEKLVAETSALMAAGTVDPQQLHAASKRHGVEFI